MVQQAQPADLTHCQTIYNAMYDDSAMEVVDEAEHTIRTWTGFTTQLFIDHGLATPAYSRITGKLQAMGCMTQLARGGGGAPSKWELHYEPTLEVYQNSKDKITGRPSKRDADDQWRRDMTQTFNELVRKVAILEARIDGICPDQPSV